MIKERNRVEIWSYRFISWCIWLKFAVRKLEDLLTMFLESDEEVVKEDKG